MALIKIANSHRIVKDAVVLDMAALDRQAERILTAAHAQVDQILAEARAEARRLTENAGAQGHAAGYELGLTEGRENGRVQGHTEAVEQSAAEIQQMTASFTSALESWEQARDAMQQEANEDILRFAFALAEKVIHRVIDHDATVVKDQLMAAICLVSRPHEITILVHPEDRPRLQELVPELTARLTECKHVEMVDDAMLDRGGCKVKTRGGAIDASIRTQLNRIAEALLPENPHLNIGDAAASQPSETT